MANKYRRKMRRFPFLCAVQYAGSQGAGEGIIEDVSLEGMRVTGNYAVQANTFLSLVIHLPDGGPPMKVAGAAVRWSTVRQFGLKLPPLPRPIQQRLLRAFGVHPSEAHRMCEEVSTAAPHAAAAVMETFKPTALLVHHNQTIVEQTADILSPEGFTVFKVPGSSEALHFLQMHQGTVDLLVLEMRLPAFALQIAPEHNPFPRIDGEELVKRVLRRTKSLRVIVLSTELRVKLWPGSGGAILPVVRLPFTVDTFLPVLQKVMNAPALIYHERCSDSHPRDIQWVG